MLKNLSYLFCFILDKWYICIILYNFRFNLLRIKILKSEEKEMNDFNVTIDAVEKQIASTKNDVVVKNNNSNFDEKNYLNTRLQKGIDNKKVKIRILPVSETEHGLFVEIKTHSLKVDSKISESGFKNFVCINNTSLPTYDKSKPCPLCSKMFELFKTAKALKNEGKIAEAQTLYDRAKMLQTKTTYIIRVIDRNNEADGPKFWKFNKNYKGDGILDKLMTLFENRRAEHLENEGKDDYNIFDLNNGLDIVLTIKRQYDKEGNELPPSINVDAETKEKPLSNDPEQVRKWVTDSKKWYDVYAVKSPEYLSIIADDKIPSKDESGNWVGQEKGKKENSLDTIKQESQNILEQQVVTTTTPNEVVTVVNTAVNSSDEEDELPF